MTSHYKFNQNLKCEFFPCHKGLEKDVFNCLFCYCPISLLGDACGGDYKTKNGIKDCSDCTKPHDSDGYAFVMGHMKTIIAKGSAFISVEGEKK